MRRESGGERAGWDSDPVRELCLDQSGDLFWVGRVGATFCGAKGLRRERSGYGRRDLRGTPRFTGDGKAFLADLVLFGDAEQDGGRLVVVLGREAVAPSAL